jgi:hypothetical protein
MERLTIDLPEFMRTIWVSEQARTTWEHRFQQISRSWESIERLSVPSLRAAALQVVTPENLPELSEEVAKRGLVAFPLARQGTSNAGYQNATTEMRPGGPWNYRVVITRPEYIPGFVEAWRAQDNDAIGAFLGFPECCRNFYEWSWVKQGWRDVAITGTVGEDGIDLTAMLPELHTVGYYQNNVFLRQLGVRLVSHLPCSLACSVSQDVGKANEKLAIKLGYLKEMEWSREILDWPLKWSSLHGVAIVTTPVVKVVYNTDALSEKVEILKDGDRYPAEGGRGDFPFRKSVHVVNSSRDNGFSSQDAMLNAHAMIVQGVMSLNIPEGAKIVDLGCGDGQLLETISDVVKVVPIGVESDKKRFEKASARLVGRAHQLCHADLFAFWDGDSQYFLGLVSINRLAEASADKAKDLLRRLKLHCEHVIFYSYVSDKWPGFPGMTNGFVVEKFLTGPNSCAALMRPVNVEIVKETEYEAN